MRSGITTAALSLLVFCGSAAQAAAPNHQESLRGLAGVALRVERIDPDAQIYGLNEMNIYADAEQRLSKAGIKLLTAAQLPQTPGAPVLYIRVTAKLSWDAPVFAVNVTAALLQDAVAARDSNVKLREAKTWDAGYTRTYPQENIRQAAAVVRDLVDEFIRDWKVANP